MATLAPVKTKKTEDSQQAWTPENDAASQDAAATQDQDSQETISYMGEFQRRAEHNAREGARARKARLLMEKAELEAKLPAAAPSEYITLRNRIADITHQIEQCDLKIVDPEISLGMDMDM